MNRYPTPEHQHAAEMVVDFFTTIPEIKTVCLICSCARGKASRDSCLDILALGKPEIMSAALTDIQKVWDEFYTTASVFQKLAAVGRYAHVDLEFSDGHFVPTEHSWVGGPDEVELVIGNYQTFPSLKPPCFSFYCYPQVFCVVYVGGSKRYTLLPVRQKVRTCWKYLLIVATLARRRSLRGDHQTNVPRTHRVWRSKARLGQRWVFSWGKCGSCGSGHKGLSTQFPSRLACNLPLGSVG